LVVTIVGSRDGCGSFNDRSDLEMLWNQPHWLEMFKFSTDPELEAKVTDAVGLYMNPPDNAVVLSVDDKTQVQALDRTQPMLPLRPGLAARRTHDCKRNGTTTLFAALEVATGKVVDACFPRHRHQKFLKQVAKAYPGVALHMCVATTPPTSTRTCGSGWRRTNGSRCILLRLRRRG
jgi:hypothetical protein